MSINLDHIIILGYNDGPVDETFWAEHQDDVPTVMHNADQSKIDI